MAHRNAFSVLAIDSDDESPTTPAVATAMAMATPATAVTTTATPATAVTATATKKTKRRSQWQPLDLSAVSDQPRAQTRSRTRRAVTSATIVASGSAPRFVRKLVNGKPVLIQVNKAVPAKVTIDPDSFPTVLGTQGVPTKVSGSWTSGVQTIREAKSLPDPSIAKRQHKLAKELWLTRQRAARVVTYYDDVSGDELINDDDLEIMDEDDLDGNLDDYEDAPDPVDESVHAPVMEEDVVHDAAADDWW